MEGAACVIDLRPQGPEAGNVQVNGPGTQLAAAGVAQLRLAAPGQNGPQENGGGPHFPHQRIWDGTAGHPAGIHRQIVPLPRRPAAQGLQNADGRLHIPQTGTTAQFHLTAGEDRGCQHRQHAVFGPLNGHFPRQAVPALDQKSAHVRPS